MSRPNLAGWDRNGGLGGRQHPNRLTPHGYSFEGIHLITHHGTDRVPSNLQAVEV